MLVVSPFLVKAQEGGMEMEVLFILFALNMSEWKSSRLISIFPMLQSCSIFIPLSEKQGKLKISGISRWLKRIQNHHFGAGFQLSPRFIFSTKGLDTLRFIFPNPI